MATSPPAVEAGEIRTLVEQLCDLLRLQVEAYDDVLYRSTIVALLNRAAVPQFLGYASDELSGASSRMVPLAVAMDRVVDQLTEAWGLAGTQLTITGVAERVDDDLKPVVLSYKDQLQARISELDRVSRTAAERLDDHHA